MAVLPAHDILKELLVENELTGFVYVCNSTKRPKYARGDIVVKLHRSWKAINMEVGDRVTTKLELSHTSLQCLAAQSADRRQ